jgi:hypothetical protein
MAKYRIVIGTAFGAPGEIVTDEDLAAAGVNVPALLVSGHLESEKSAPARTKNETEKDVE